MIKSYLLTSLFKLKDLKEKETKNLNLIQVH